ncbi:MAG: AmmeMemoRadiSam system protein B [Nitrospirae bacterium]|nr:MAG: AmmeMemoRadiSam system protein B [Nitrospirota bacterium]
MIRTPAVAGYFYYGTGEALLNQVEGYIDEDAPKEEVLGVLSPHAGLMYSGAVAGSVYSRIKMPDTFILIGPNHTGMGSDISIMSSGVWEMPMGSIKIDETLAKKILNETNIVTDDPTAHYYEHSLEVQLPFIYYFSRSVKIVPITMLSTSYEDCVELGNTLAKVIGDVEYSVVIVASSDMTHYESDEVARQKDELAIEKILALDPEGLYTTVRRYGISMCGFAPATTMLIATKQLGATKAELVSYMTSGEVSGDYEKVVGYAGILIKK